MSILAWVAFSTFWILSKWGFHEMWKDEWQAWFVAKDKSIGALFSFLYYEGHPALWYLYLKLFTPLEGLLHAADILHVSHAILMVGVGYLLFLRLELPLWLKVLLASSYFIVFEYGLINRGYALVMLLAFGVTYLLHKKENHTLWPIATLMFLLCQTEVYGVFIAGGLMVYYWLERQSWSSMWSDSLSKAFWAGIIVFMISVWPRTSGHVASTQGKKLDFQDKVLTAFQGNLSNTFMIGSTPDTAMFGATASGLGLSLLCVCGLFFIFRRHRPSGLAMAAFMLVAFLFSVLFFVGGVRQWGMAWIMLICLLSLMGISWQKDKISVVILSIFSLFGIVHGYKAVKADYDIPFSNARAAGQFILAKVPEKVPVIALNKFEATPVIGYAGRKFYELPSGNPFSYFKWVDKVYLPTENEIKLFGQFKKVGGVILLSPKPIDIGRFPNAQLWQKFDAESYKKEQYYIYTMSSK
jgi:hypothetical protein